MSAKKLQDFRCWTEIDLAAYERNVKGIQAALPTNVRYISVVKADAYGHGMPQMVRRLMQCGVDFFAVANVAEAMEIRQMGTGWPILVLGPILPHEMEPLFEDELIATISTAYEAEQLNQLAGKRGVVLKVHLKIDTGMGRLGIWHEDAEALFETITRLPGISIEGIYTHFSSAHNDPDFTALQRNRFASALKRFPPGNWLIHADNSASLGELNSGMHFDAVRIGLLQFGVPPYPDSPLGKTRVLPVMSFHTRVGMTKYLPRGAAISYNQTFRLKRDSLIGVLTAGYGDGLPLSMSNNSEVLIHGQRCPVIGRVTMDQTIVDLSSIKGVLPGDQATLIGKNENDQITLQEFSDKTDSIPWETLCSITKRVNRIYNGTRGTE